MLKFIFTILGVYKRRAARAERDAVDARLSAALIDDGFFDRVTIK